MALIRICSSCETHNNISESLCKRCGVDISGINPVEKGEPRHAAPQAGRLMLKMHDGKSICIEDSCILGRERTGNELFSSNLKVSREHARVTVENSSWFIEDLNSTNGVYLNGVRMEKGIRTKLLSGQKVSLSLSCEFMVVLDQVDREY